MDIDSVLLASLGIPTPTYSPDSPSTYYQPRSLDFEALDSMGVFLHNTSPSYQQPSPGSSPTLPNANSHIHGASLNVTVLNRDRLEVIMQRV